MKYKLGPKITLGPDTRVNDKDHIFGPGWFAVRTKQGFELSWDGGELMTEDVYVAISEDEFERLRHEPGAFKEISFEHNPLRKQQ